MALICKEGMTPLVTNYGVFNPQIPKRLCMDILRGQSPQHDIQFNLTTNENNHNNKKEKNHVQPGKWPDPKSRQS